MSDKLTKWRRMDRAMGPEVEAAGMRWDSAARALERAELAESQAGTLYVVLRQAARQRAQVTD